MTNVAHWISPHIMESLGWTLVHFLWQGTALAALFWILITTIRHAAIRYVAGVLVLVAMAAAPSLRT